MKFSDWYNEADMPTRQADGSWVDLETGHSYAHACGAGKKQKAERKETALEINGKPAKVSEGLAYAAKLLAGQQYSFNKFSAYPDSDAKAAYLLIAEEAIDALTALTQKSKKAEISAAIRLNQDASRLQNAITK